MVITGIADEASPDLEQQIKVHKELGWNTIELRLIGKTNICEIDEDSFGQVCELLNKEGMDAICFASPIANWARSITADFSKDTEDLIRSAPRMRRLGTRFIRIMSYPNDGLEDREWRREVFKRMRELARLAEEEDIVLVHENCSGWGGVSPQHQRELLEEIDSLNFQIVFDTGNPVGEGHAREETWDFYQSARPFIKHIHIKDCRQDEKGEVIYTFPGEGWSMVREILKDALKSGYQGAFSIEPHITAQIHLGNVPAAGDNPVEVYLEYGRRTNKLLDELSGPEPQSGLSRRHSIP